MSPYSIQVVQKKPQEPGQQQDQTRQQEQQQEMLRARKRRGKVSNVYSVAIKGADPVREGIVDVLSMRGFIRAFRAVYRKDNLFDRALVKTINSSGSMAKAF